MRSPLSYLTFWFVPLLVRFNVYLGATKGLFDASVVLLLVTACTSSAIAMILGHLTDLGFCQGQRWAVFAGPVMLLGVSLFSAVSSVSSMVVMARMSLRRRLIVKASQDNVGAMHSRVEESYGAQKLVQAACSCDSDGRHFAPVKAALARLARGKTTVTTIADTDWIVVLDNGVVHEQVTQAELLVRPSGLFHQLYKLQTAGRTHP